MNNRLLFSATFEWTTLSSHDHAVNNDGPSASRNRNTYQTGPYRVGCYHALRTLTENHEVTFQERASKSNTYSNYMVALALSAGENPKAKTS